MIKNKILRILLLMLLASGVVFAQDKPAPDAEIPEAFRQAIKEAEVDPLKEVISLDYKDADISGVLRSLSYTYGLNLVTSTEVKGKITISLKDVTLGEALDAILSANGYNYSRKGSIIYISPGSVEGAQLVSELITLKYFDVADAQNILRKVLSPKGDIKVDEMANMLIVTDYEANIRKLKELLKDVDQPPQQVLIEAKIVDITSKDLRNLGVTWQVDYNPLHGLFDRKTDTQERLKGTGTFAGPSSSLTGGQLKLDTLVLKGLTASATLDALIQDQKANLLASPSIAVLNNREARIIIGEKVPYKERTQTTTGTTETTKFIEVGTTLRVTPTINADGYITLNVHPEVSSVTALLDAGPRITTREADTMVRIREGETLVIGGLIKQEDNRTNSRVPVLGYIPILGYAFGNRSKDQTQTELAVFITPKILRSREEMLAEGSNRYQEEAYVNIMASGSLNVQKHLFDTARRLQSDEGLESRRKDDWQRKSQALNIYESILTQFPDGPKAAESGYRAAQLYYELGELYTARDLCAKIASNYPSSEFAAKCKSLHKTITALLSKQARPREQTRRATPEESRTTARAEEPRKTSEEELQALKRKAEEEAKRADEVERKRALEERLAKERERLRAQEAAARAKEEARKRALEERLAKERERLRAQEEAARAEEEARKKAEEERIAQLKERITKEKERLSALEEVASAEEEARIKAEQERIAQEEARRRSQRAAERREIEARIRTLEEEATR